MRRTCPLAAGVVSATLLTLTAACGSAHKAPAAPGAVEPVTVPYVTMDGPQAGVLVWPSGGDWVLVSTTDGFRHVTNRTPPAVDTQGGLSVAVSRSRVAVAVGAHERLAWSPILDADASWHWRPSEPPGAVSGARGDLAVTGNGVYAVLAARGGTLIRQDSAGGRWQRLGRPATPEGGGAPTRFDAVVWDGPDGVLTGHGAAGAATAWVTHDAGAHWRPVPSTSGHARAALRPCGVAPAWKVPVVDAAGDLRLVSSDGTAGAPVTVGTGPVTLGCSGADVLVVDRRGHVLASSDLGGHWSDRGAAPRDLTSLAPTGADSGFAASGGSSPTLWRFSGDGAAFTRVPLPAWVASLGGQSGSD